MIEITSYVLGMLTIAAILLLIALVLGMVKINKLEKQTITIEKMIEGVYQSIDHERQHIQQLLESTHRDINMIEQTIMNQVRHVDDFHHRKEDDLEKEIIQTKSYIDSRIDKVVLHGTLPSRKPLIKE
jgi:peptidoglycan hydrolase CwlO-like protein